MGRRGRRWRFDPAGDGGSAVASAGLRTEGGGEEKEVEEGSMGGHHPERDVRRPVSGYDLWFEGDGSEGQHLHGVASGAGAQVDVPRAGELWTRRRRLVGKQKEENGGEEEEKGGEEEVPKV